MELLVHWLGHGLADPSLTGIVAYSLLTTHVTIVCVTLFLHRSQAHRALDLHPVASHLMRGWLWLATGIVTREWVAVHRKHHARCDTADDPHSPQTRGIREVLLRGSELYRTASRDPQTLADFGRGAPDDWLERNLYTRLSWHGIGVMLVVNVVLFGALGLVVWAVQMAWIPVTAARIVNGIGHWWGYRNFESADASRNFCPWGILIGGEELHNNHHTYPTSAKLSVKPYEFDIGWLYIRVLQSLGMARVRKVAPRIRQGSIREAADGATLQAVINNRFELMARYGRGLRRAGRAEVDRVRREHASSASDLADMHVTARWVHRDWVHVPAHLKERVKLTVASSEVLSQLVSMRSGLYALWTQTNVSADQLVVDLHEWLTRAESSGIEVLRETAFSLRSIRA